MDFGSRSRLFEDDDEEQDLRYDMDVLANKEYVVYLIDAGCDMMLPFENGDSCLKSVMKAVEENLKTRIVAQDDKVGICFFNTLKKKNIQEANGSTHPGDFSSQPPLPTEQPGLAVVESSLTTREVMEKFHLVAQKLDAALPKLTTVIYVNLPPDHEVRSIVAELQEIITQAISRDDVALAVTQKIFQRLYEYATSHLHISVHLKILEAFRDVCKRVVKEITSWVVSPSLRDGAESRHSIVFQPRGRLQGARSQPELVKALLCVAKALVWLHERSIMHRDIR